MAACAARRAAVCAGGCVEGCAGSLICTFQVCGDRNCGLQAAGSTLHLPSTPCLHAAAWVRDDVAWRLQAAIRSRSHIQGPAWRAPGGPAEQPNYELLLRRVPTRDELWRLRRRWAQGVEQHGELAALREFAVMKCSLLERPCGPALAARYCPCPAALLGSRPALPGVRPDPKFARPERCCCPGRPCWAGRSRPQGRVPWAAGRAAAAVWNNRRPPPPRRRSLRTQLPSILSLPCPCHIPAGFGASSSPFGASSPSPFGQQTPAFGQASSPFGATTTTGVFGQVRWGESFPVPVSVLPAAAKLAGCRFGPSRKNRRCRSAAAEPARVRGVSRSRVWRGAGLWAEPAGVWGLQCAGVWSH